jgi:L-2-hydroxyglutarate oxidase
MQRCKLSPQPENPESPKDSWGSPTFPGTWELFLRHRRYSLNEYKRAFFKGQFLRQLQRLIPSLRIEDIKPSRAGVRAQALGPNGELIEDFKIEKGVNSIHVLNAPSPAATASPVIGETVSQVAAEHFNL